MLLGRRSPRRGFVIRAVESALRCLEAGELDHDVEAAVAGLERELDERAGTFRDQDGGVVDGAWDEYLMCFRQARAAAALRFLFKSDAATAAGEAIFEAGAASDEYFIHSVCSAYSQGSAR